MFRKIIIVLFLIIAVSSGITFYYFYWYKEKPSNEITLYGNVDVRLVDLGFRVSGRVEQMLFNEGDFVPPNTLVGFLDKQPYLDQVLQAEAMLAASQALLANADLVLRRRRELIKDGSISQEDLDNAIANQAVAASNVDSSLASLAIAETNLSFTEVYSPNEGIILTRIREPGSVVNTGEPIYTLSIIAPVWIRSFVAEPLLGLVYPGMPAKIYTDTPNGKVYEGHVGFISPMAEFTPKTVETAQLRTDLVYRLRIYAKNPDHGLRQGMPVTVKLLLNEHESSQDDE